MLFNVESKSEIIFTLHMVLKSLLTKPLLSKPTLRRQEIVILRAYKFFHIFKQLRDKSILVLSSVNSIKKK